MLLLFPSYILLTHKIYYGGTFMNFDLKSFYKNPLILVCIITIISIGLFMFNNSQTPRELKTLRSIGVAITNINLENTLNINDISSKNYIESLEKKVIDMKNISTTVESLKTSTDYSSFLDRIKSGIDNNILLYNQLIAILNSPDSLDIYNSYENVDSLKNQCEETYLWCRDNDIPVYLTKENNDYLHNILLYINQLIKFNRDIDIKTSQKNDFIISVDRVNRNFNPLTEDLFSIIEAIKKDNRDITVLISDVHSKIKNLEILQDELYLIPIPENGRPVFDSLENTLDLYKTYINTMLKALSAEKSNNNLIYQEAQSQYDDVITSLEQFQTLLDNYKNN